MSDSNISQKQRNIQTVLEFFQRIMDVIVQSRQNCQPTLDSLNRPKGVIDNTKYSRSITWLLKNDPYIPLVLEVLVVENGKAPIVLEKWNFCCDLQGVDSATTGRQLNALSKRIGLLLRTVYCFARLLPSFYIKLSSNAQLTYKISNASDFQTPPSTFIEPSLQHNFPSIATSIGRITLFLEYLNPNAVQALCASPDQTAAASTATTPPIVIGQQSSNRTPSGDGYLQASPPQAISYSDPPVDSSPTMNPNYYAGGVGGGNGGNGSSGPLRALHNNTSTSAPVASYMNNNYIRSSTGAVAGQANTAQQHHRSSGAAGIVAEHGSGSGGRSGGRPRPDEPHRSSSSQVYVEVPYSSSTGQGHGAAQQHRRRHSLETHGNQGLFPIGEKDVSSGSSVSELESSTSQTFQRPPVPPQQTTPLLRRQQSRSFEDQLNSHTRSSSQSGVSLMQHHHEQQHLQQQQSPSAGFGFEGSQPSLIDTAAARQSEKMMYIANMMQAHASPGTSNPLSGSLSYQPPGLGATPPYMKISPTLISTSPSQVKPVTATSVALSNLRDQILHKSQRMGVSLVSAPQGTQGYSPVSTTNGSGEQFDVSTWLVACGPSPFKISYSATPGHDDTQMEQTPVADPPGEQEEDDYTYYQEDDDMPFVWSEDPASASAGRDVHSSGQQEASSFAQMCASPPSLTTYAEAELLTNSLAIRDARDALDSMSAAYMLDFHPQIQVPTRTRGASG